ncbi:MAG: glycosyltransferase family 4 protein [Candidatus Omnitrophica bacterium]|nr:glycosyltransferase family 4 protein [Candidatus Omnitrophota bacterium]
MQEPSKKIKILICGILPPPYFGHSMLYKMLMASSFPNAFETKFLNMQFWTYGTHKKVTIEKLFKMAKYYIIFIGILVFWRPKYFLYNSSFYRMPYLKDFLFCSTGIFLGCKLVIHDHGQYVRELDESLTGFSKASLRWMLKNMAGSIIMGEKVRQDYEGLADQAKLMVVPGTVEDTKEIMIDSPKIPGVINVLCFSHMSRLKGVYTAFEAIPIILTGRADIIVTFGGPFEDQEVKSCLEELQKNYPGRIRYGGYVEDVVERTRIFREADIFIFPTFRDVFGLVLLHAMAEGLAIVASREGTIPEIIQDGTNALLVEKGDAKALADKVLLLAGDHHLRKLMGQANRRRFEEMYTLEKYGDAMINAFKQIDALDGDVDSINLSHTFLF